MSNQKSRFRSFSMRSFKIALISQSLATIAITAYMVSPIPSAASISFTTAFLVFFNVNAFFFALSLAVYRASFAALLSFADLGGAK